MWTLIWILFDAGTPKAVMMGNYFSMVECFSEREMLSESAGGGQGYFPVNQQAICVQRGPEDITWYNFQDSLY